MRVQLEREHQRRSPPPLGSLLAGAAAAALVLVTGCSGASTVSDSRDPISNAEAWVHGYWEAMTTRTRDQAPFLAEEVFFDHLTALDYSCEGRWNTTEWWRSYFGDEVEEMAYGRMYLDIDGSIYPYTVELGSKQDFAGLILLEIGPKGIETVRQIAANTQPVARHSALPFFICHLLLSIPLIVSRQGQLSQRRPDFRW